ncbi:MAG: 3-phosphoshikimate 1-carboxyvinyltransferase [Chitinophagaceae bacterium]|nr:3-phosphoshikimate 1-carboxyvinyltransferase [Chitinophagaceae bacterium]
MIVTIKPSRLKGNIQAPASKSSMQRACAAALLRKGTTIINNAGHSNDDKAALGIIKALGAKINKDGNSVIVTSNGLQPVSSTIDCGESGLSIRMFTPLVALSGEEITITGSGSLVTRPMDVFDEIFPTLGVSIQTQDGKLPLIVQGPLLPADIEVDGSLSSQFLTGLLMAYGAYPYIDAGGKDTEVILKASIIVHDLKSRPYIDLTLDVMKKFGFVTPTNNNYEEFIFDYTETQSEHPRIEMEVNYIVEGDWSGGAFLLVAGAIAGSILVSGLDVNSTQADKKILDALMAANAGLAIEAKGIRLVPGEMIAFDFDATDCPDLFPPLVALAAYCKGSTKIKGVGRLIHKESNRALTLQDEFDKMGVTIDIDGDTMIIHGGKVVKGADVHSQHDHRIAMACAVAALGADSEMVIEEAQAVNKSYPDFYSHLENLGAGVSLNNKLSWHE